jgi:hypothetical protein
MREGFVIVGRNVRLLDLIQFLIEVLLILRLQVPRLLQLMIYSKVMNSVYVSIVGIHSQLCQ